MKKLLLCLMIICPFLTACTTPIPASGMFPNVRTYSYLEQNRLTHNVALGTITLSDAMPQSGFIVTAPEFKKVLDHALSEAHWLNGKKPGYILNADFIKQSIPFSLFNSKVITTVDYTLKSAKSGDIVYNQRVIIPCVVTFAEEPQADSRVMRALQCAVGENVTHLLRDLNNRF